MPVPKALAGHRAFLSQGAHPNREIPGKHAKNVERGLSEHLQGPVQAPVSILDMLRAARHWLLPQNLGLNSLSEMAGNVRFCQGKRPLSDSLSGLVPIATNA
jgi:hypothetical protein